MSQNYPTTAAARATIADLAKSRLVQNLNPVSARFVYSLRLIALHKRANRDPVPELAARLNSVEVAAKALGLAETVSAIWPENIHVSRFCCCKLTHDEATIAEGIECALHRDRISFDQTIEGLIRSDRMEKLWDSVLSLIDAELRAC
jgi:hypothetical protein